MHVGVEDHALLRGAQHGSAVGGERLRRRRLPELERVELGFRDALQLARSVPGMPWAGPSSSARSPPSL